jgi:hypothetical protein
MLIKEIHELAKTTKDPAYREVKKKKKKKIDLFLETVRNRPSPQRLCDPNKNSQCSSSRRRRR